MNIFIPLLVGTIALSVCLSQNRKIPFLEKGIMTDIDGNIYRTVTLGNQIWTWENIRTTRYSDGTPIPLATDSSEWVNLTTPGYCFFNNTTNADSIRLYGALYNWYAVDTKKLAPVGWRVPSNDDWDILKEHLSYRGYNSQPLFEMERPLYVGARQIRPPVPHYYKNPDAEGFRQIIFGENGRGRAGGYFFLNGGWWSTSEWDTSQAFHFFYQNAVIDMGGGYFSFRPLIKANGISVRLVSNRF